MGTPCRGHESPKTPAVLPARLLTHPPGAKKRSLTFSSIVATPSRALEEVSAAETAADAARDLLRDMNRLESLVRMLKSKLSADDGDSRAWRFSGEEQNVQQSLAEFLGALEKQLLLIHPTFVNVFRLRDQTLSVTALGNRLVMELLQHLCGGSARRCIMKSNKTFEDDGKAALITLVRTLCPDHAEFASSHFVFASTVDLDGTVEPTEWLSKWHDAISGASGELGEDCQINLSRSVEIQFILRRICPLSTRSCTRRFLTTR